MFRGCLLLLMLGYAAVPPGICFCRLSALALADANPIDDDDDDGDCGCPRIQHDGMLAGHIVLLQTTTDAAHIPPPVAFSTASFTPPEPFEPCLSPPACPLYLTLRALLI